MTRLSRPTTGSVARRPAASRVGTPRRPGAGRAAPALAAAGALLIGGLAVAAPAAADGRALDSLETLPARAALPGLIQRLLDAVPADSTVWKRLVADDVVYVSEAGAVAGKADLLEGFRPFPPGLSGSLEVREPRISEHGDVAIVVFDAHERQRVFDQSITVDYLNSHVWRRRDGRWRLVAAHAAVRAKDPPAQPVDRRRLADYAGTYELGAWRYRIEARGDTLLGGSATGTLRPLVAVGDNVFVDAGNPLAVLRLFPRGPDGRVDRMVQRRKFADLTWKRVAP